MRTIFCLALAAALFGCNKAPATPAPAPAPSTTGIAVPAAPAAPTAAAACDDNAKKATKCAGIGGFKCPAGFTCIDDPCDDCDPNKGGADCGGICVTAAAK